jgi:gas vesicle protein
MDSKEGYGTGALVLAFLTGATAGAVAALLLAPEAGPKTRERLASLASSSERKLKLASEAFRTAYLEAQASRPEPPK